MNTEITKDFDVEEFDDFDLNEEVTYLVCALGYNEDDDCTDCEVYLEEFEDPAEAIAFAKAVDLEKLLQYAVEQKADISETAYFSLEVETVVPFDAPDEGTENIDTIYSRDLWIDGEYDSEDDIPDCDDPIVAMASDDYSITEDGLLKVSCELLEDFNKNDIIYVDFVGEPDATIMKYQIVSKVIYADGDYYHCELLI